MAAVRSVERNRTVPEVDANRYERLDCIGRGSFGDVYRGCHICFPCHASATPDNSAEASPFCRLDRETNSEVAIKVIDLEDVYAPLLLPQKYS